MNSACTCHSQSCLSSPVMESAQPSMLEIQFQNNSFPLSFSLQSHIIVFRVAASACRLSLTLPQRKNSGVCNPDVPPTIMMRYVALNVCVQGDSERHLNEENWKQFHDLVYCRDTIKTRIKLEMFTWFRVVIGIVLDCIGLFLAFNPSRFLIFPFFSSHCFYCGFSECKGKCVVRKIFLLFCQTHVTKARRACSWRYVCFSTRNSH